MYRKLAVEADAVHGVHQQGGAFNRVADRIRLIIQTDDLNAGILDTGEHFARLKAGGVAAQQGNGHFGACLEQLACDDEAVAAVIAPPAQYGNAAAADGIPRADHPCRGTAGVFHQTEIIESLRHRGRLHQAHFPCSQYFHAVHLPFRIKVEIRIKRRAQRSVFSPGVILPARPLGSKPPAQPAGYPACG